MRLLRSVRDGKPSKQFGGQQRGRSFWSERDARSFHVLRERRTTVRADKHAYQTMLITSRHTQARRDLQQSLEFGDAQVHTWQNRWSLVSDNKTARHLKLPIDISKRKIVDSLFQAIRDKLGKQRAMHSRKLS